MSRYLDQRIPDNHFRIIGVEFTIDSYNGNEELEMFTPSGLLILPKSHSGGNLYPKITFHTTIGDHTIGGRQMGGYCPW